MDSSSNYALHHHDTAGPPTAPASPPGRPSCLPLLRCRRSLCQLHTRIPLSSLVTATRLFHSRSIIFGNCLDGFDTIAWSSGLQPRGKSPIWQQSNALTISSGRCSSRAKNSREHTVSNYSCWDGANLGCRAEYPAAGISKGFPTETWLNVRVFRS